MHGILEAAIAIVGQAVTASEPTGPDGGADASLASSIIAPAVVAAVVSAFVAVWIAKKSRDQAATLARETREHLSELEGLKHGHEVELARLRLELERRDKRDTERWSAVSDLEQAIRRSYRTLYESDDPIGQRLVQARDDLKDRYDPVAEYLDGPARSAVMNVPNFVSQFRDADKAGRDYSSQFARVRNEYYDLTIRASRLLLPRREEHHGGSGE